MLNIWSSFILFYSFNSLFRCFVSSQVKPWCVINKLFAIVLDAKDADKEHTGVDKIAQQPDTEINSFYLCFLDRTSASFLIRELRFQEETSRNHSSEYTDQSPCDWWHETTVVKFLVCCDISLWQVKTTIPPWEVWGYIFVWSVHSNHL